MACSEFLYLQRHRGRDHLIAASFHMRLSGSSEQTGDPAVFVNREAQVIVLFRPVELMLLVIHNRYIRARFNVLSEHFVIRCVVESVAPGQNDIFLRTAANIAHYGTNCIDRSPVNAGIIPRYKGRKDKQTVPFAVEIPFLSAAEVIHQRAVSYTHLTLPTNSRV